MQHLANFVMTLDITELDTDDNDTENDTEQQFSNIIFDDSLKYSLELA